MRMAWRWLGAMCAVAVIGASGCWFLVGAGVGAGALAGYSYVKGEGSKMYAGDARKCAEATGSALKKMNIVVVNSSCDKLAGEINARLRDDTAVAVYLKAEREDVTKVTIRVGTFGDKTRTEMIFKAIDEELGVR